MKGGGGGGGGGKNCQNIDYVISHFQMPKIQSHRTFSGILIGAEMCFISVETVGGVWGCE